MARTTPRKGRPRRSEVDWDAIERLYVEGEFVTRPGSDEPERVLPSYADLAKRFDLRTASIGDRGRIDGWPGKRKAFTQSLQTRAHQKRIETVSSALAETTRRTMAIGDKLLEEIDRAIDWARTHPPARRDRGGRRGGPAGGAVAGAPGSDEEVPAGEPEPLDAVDIDRFASALKKLVETRQVELGLTTPKGDGEGGTTPPKGDGEAAARRADGMAESIVEAAVDAVLAQNQAPRTHGAGSEGDD